METTLQSVTPFSRFEHAFVGGLYMLFCVVGISLNLLTALTFYKDLRLLTSSKPWLHIALALANIGVVAPAPFPASSSFSGKWLYGNTMCQMYAFEGMFIGLSAIGLVVAMCIERYAVGSKSSADNTGWFYVSAIVVTLGNALFWSSMPLLGWTRYAIDATGTSCALDYGKPDEGFTSYLFTMEMCSFGFPLLVAVMCLVYSSGGGSSPAVASSASGEQASAAAAVAGSSGDQSSSHPTLVTDNSRSGFSEDQLKMMCCVFLFLVVLGWGPFALICTMSAVAGPSGVSMLGNVIPPLACKAMVIAYPATYAVASPRFRKSFTSFFKCDQADAKQD